MLEKIPRKIEKLRWNYSLKLTTPPFSHVFLITWFDIFSE